MAIGDNLLNALNTIPGIRAQKAGLRFQLEYDPTRLPKHQWPRGTSPFDDLYRLTPCRVYGLGEDLAFALERERLRPGHPGFKEFFDIHVSLFYKPVDS